MIASKQLVVINGLLMVVVLAGLIFRLTGLTHSPPAFYLDEASIAYNAWLISQTGADEFGRAWPVYFEAFGEFKNPLFIYIQAAFFALLPATNYTARLTSALVGLVTVLVGVYLAWLVKPQLNFGLIIAGLLLWMPWHLLLSRIVFEVITMPLFLLASVVCLWLFEQRRQSGYYYGHLIALGVGVYSYTAMRFLAPVLVLASMVIFYRQVRFKRLVVGVILFGMSVVPLLVWLRHYPETWGYAYERATLFKGMPLKYALPELVKNYLSHFSWSFWLGGGDGFRRHMMSIRAGLLWSIVPLVGLGVWRLLARWRNTGWFQYVFFLGLIAPLPAAVTTQAPHGLRSSGLIVFVWVALIWGVKFLLESGWVSRFIISLLVVVIGIEIGSLASYFWYRYPSEAGPAFGTQVEELILRAQDQEAPFFLGQAWYPENLVMWRWYLKQPVESELIQPANVFDRPLTVQGTYVFGQFQCDIKPPEWFTKQVIYENSEGCVVRFEKAN